MSHIENKMPSSPSQTLKGFRVSPCVFGRVTGSAVHAMRGCPVSCRSCSGCGPRSARPRGALEPRAPRALSAPKRFIVRPNQPREPQPRRVSRHDTPHGPFFSLRARVRLRCSLRLVAPKGAVQWGPSGASRSKKRWGGGLTARVDVDLGVFAQVVGYAVMALQHWPGIRCMVRLAHNQRNARALEPRCARARRPARHVRLDGGPARDGPADARTRRGDVRFG